MRWFATIREPKESILRRFDVTVISRYFPEFERQMPRYLSQFDKRVHDTVFVTIRQSTLR